MSETVKAQPVDLDAVDALCAKLKLLTHTNDCFVGSKRKLSCICGITDANNALHRLAAELRAARERSARLEWERDNIAEKLAVYGREGDEYPVSAVVFDLLWDGQPFVCQCGGGLFALSGQDAYQCASCSAKHDGAQLTVAARAAQEG